MSNLNLKSKEQNTYDAIVIGSGMSGGWAAKELCEKGLKTLVLERGRDVKHGDYPTANMDPWDHENRGMMTEAEVAKRYKQNRSGVKGMDTKHFFVDDHEHPYIEKKRFDWIRGHHVGGRSLMWGRQCYRWSDIDFTANAKEGIGVEWPIGYADIAPWYSYVEKFVGISGQKLGLEHLPDGEFLKPMELNCLERHVKEYIEKNYEDRYLTIGRCANLTEPIHGRGTCQRRNRCSRGCPYGAYFSSNSVTLPAAEKTGNLTLRPFSVVSEILYDQETKRATGVRLIDQNTKETYEYFAKIIFTNASTIGSTSILLHSKSDRFPTGMGNDSGELGHNMMDHHYFAGAMGTYEGFADKFYRGRRPNGIYIPRYRNLDVNKTTTKYRRGYGYQGGASRKGTSRGNEQQGFGGDFKDSLSRPGEWTFFINGFGEILPRHTNKMSLHEKHKDQWGLPIPVMDADFVQNDLDMREDMKADAAEMLEKAGIKDIYVFDKIGGMGKGIHEMGTARMGKDANTSVLNKHNQIHAVPNVFVTDGACMTSASCVNPSITYMALTARAVDHAVRELNKQNL